MSKPTSWKEAVEDLRNQEPQLPDFNKEVKIGVPPYLEEAAEDILNPKQEPTIRFDGWKVIEEIHFQGFLRELTELSRKYRIGIALGSLELVGCAQPVLFVMTEEDMDREYRVDEEDHLLF